MKELLPLLDFRGLIFKKFDACIDFLTLSAFFADKPGTVVLLSGGELDCSRFNILATDPVLSIRAKREIIKVKLASKEVEFNKDPFLLLREIIRFYSFDFEFESVPVVSGLFGYFSYDLKDFIEKLPRTSIDDLNLPDMLLYLPSLIVIEDRFEEVLYVISLTSDPVKRVELLLKGHKDRNVFFEEKKFFIEGDFKSNFTYESYIEAIEKIKDYILNGHVYQVNLSQRFYAGFSGSPFSLFKKLFLKNPAPFFAYINANDHYIVSTSPERFLFRKKDYVETRPIKGTRPRGKTDEEDTKFKQELLSSIKDDAELSMIVDLLRNDLGKVCRANSVKVKEHKRLEKYDNVYHLVSIVTGLMEEDKDEIDLLRGAFPGGSITGCPKVRAMEIIDELEPNRRHIYTGSIGYISFHKTMDLSIAIRTATLIDDRLFFSVGGGIVFDSDPELEYEETIHKGKTFLQVLGTQKKPSKKKYVWLNGHLVPDHRASILVDSQGFSYGYGFFETIRAKNGKIFFLKDHIERFNNTWSKLFHSRPLDLTWEDVILQVLEKNEIDGVARVKLMVARDSDSSVWGYHLSVSATSYVHRLKKVGKIGLELCTYPYPRLTPLARFKSLNYLYYYLAGKWAVENGVDEALILNSDGSISETNTANIFFVNFYQKKVVVTDSLFSLPGVMLKNVCGFLSCKGYEIIKKKILKKELNYLIDHNFVAIVSNSLMGVVPILKIDDIRFNVNKETLHFLREMNMVLIEEEIP